MISLAKSLNPQIHRQAPTEPYGAIRRKHAPAQAGGGAIEGNAADDALMVDQGSKIFVDMATTK